MPITLLRGLVQSAWVVATARCLRLQGRLQLQLFVGVCVLLRLHSQWRSRSIIDFVASTLLAGAYGR